MPTPRRRGERVARLAVVHHRIRGRDRAAVRVERQLVLLHRPLRVDRLVARALPRRRHLRPARARREPAEELMPAPGRRRERVARLAVVHHRIRRRGRAAVRVERQLVLLHRPFEALDEALVVAVEVRVVLPVRPAQGVRATACDVHALPAPVILVVAGVVAADVRLLDTVDQEDQLVVVRLARRPPPEPDRPRPGNGHLQPRLLAVADQSAAIAAVELPGPVGVAACREPEGVHRPVPGALRRHVHQLAATGRARVPAAEQIPAPGRRRQRVVRRAVVRHHVRRRHLPAGGVERQLVLLHRPLRVDRLVPRALPRRRHLRAACPRGEPAVERMGGRPRRRRERVAGLAVVNHRIPGRHRAAVRVERQLVLLHRPLRVEGDVLVHRLERR